MARHAPMTKMVSFFYLVSGGSTPAFLQPPPVSSHKHSQNTIIFNGPCCVLTKEFMRQRFLFYLGFHLTFGKNLAPPSRLCTMHGPGIESISIRYYLFSSDFLHGQWSSEGRWRIQGLNDVWQFSSSLSIQSQQVLNVATNTEFWPGRIHNIQPSVKKKED